MGIIPERIQRGCPRQNGRHERMHRTLKKATTRPAAGNLLAQQQRFDQFMDEFNGQTVLEGIHCWQHVGEALRAKGLKRPRIL